MQQEKEFYLGLTVWLLTILIAYAFWVSGDEGIDIAFTATNIVIALLFFGIYLLGYLLSHGVIGFGQARQRRIFGLTISALATAYLSLFMFYFAMLGCMAMMLVIQLSTLLEQKWAMVAGILVPAAFETLNIWLGKEFDYTTIVVYAIVYELALITSYRAIAEKAAKIESEQLVRELKATQVLLGATTKRDERLRIARNLHDILGHHLTALGLQLEVATHVEGEAQQEHIRNAQKISTSLLAKVRETVSEFRTEKDLKLHEALSVLVEGLPKLEARLQLEWDESRLDERQVEVLFRCAQEALTNIIRHSGATRCEVRGFMDEDFVILEVKDNGSEASEIKPGNGLNGMRERIEKLDGSLSFENSADGFVLTLKLPLTD